MFDAGIDASFFDNRLSATFDYYYSKTTDLLYNYSVPVPPFAYGSMLANLGSMMNEGVFGYGNTFEKERYGINCFCKLLMAEE